MKLKILIALIFFAAAALIAFTQINRRTFAAGAADFPGGALAYVQITDLPKFIQLWDESGFKEKYLASQNFQDFQNRHLGLKLASRWEEFNSAAGFPLDLATLSGLTGGSAGIALYDVGKLDFVFIAPMNEEVFAATKFAQGKDNFEEETLEDGTIFYQANVEADRGRQKQKIIFACLKGKFVLATSEKLFVQTLANINKTRGRNTLANQPAFKNLSEKIEPHIATVWIDQFALNNDYYFKRYWLMTEAEKLKNIRAGIFDFSMEEGKLIERRRFLLDRPVNLPALDAARAEKTLAYLPAEIPLYRLQTPTGQTLNAAIRNTIFDRREKTPPKSKSRRYYSSDGFEDYADYREEDYSSLDGKFDETIDEADDNETTVKSNETETDFSIFLESAKPQTVLTFAEPKLLPAPLFAEFRRAAVFSLASPENFNREAFESVIEKSYSARLLIAAPGAKFNWETKTENDLSWSEMNLPELGLSACYTLRGGELILANSPELLREISGTQNSQDSSLQDSSLTELAVLNFDQRENSYDRIFNDLAAKKSADDFFTGNIASLLDAASEIKSIEIKKSCRENFIDEEVVISLKKK